MDRSRYQHSYTLLGYLVIALALGLFGAILALVGRWAVVHDISPREFMAWFGAIGSTAVLFGVLIKIHRPHWRRKMFWKATAVLLVLHTVGFWLILRNVQDVQMAWFFAIAAVEMPLFIVALHPLMYRHEKRKR